MSADPDEPTVAKPMRTDTRPGHLVVLTGPSGVGKGTVVAEVRRLAPDVWVSVSVTTRAPRTGEANGDHYFFWSEPRFSEAVAVGGLLEWAEFAGSRYGTPREAVERHLAAGELLDLLRS